MPLSAKSRRTVALAGVGLSVLILIPGLFLPVLTVRGSLNPNGLSDLSVKLLQQGVSDTTINAIRPMLNPAVLPLVEGRPGGLKGVIVDTLGGQISKELRAGQPIEVYSQTRSIVGSVRHLYSVGSNTAATLILFFSIVVPLTKSLLVSWAVFVRNAALRRRTLFFVEAIAKWSMADVFAVAVMIAYLAAQASQSLPGSTTAAVVSFDAAFGTGFYCFATYCLTSLAVQQLTARWLMKEVVVEAESTVEVSL